MRIPGVCLAALLIAGTGSFAMGTTATLTLAADPSEALSVPSWEKRRAELGQEWRKVLGPLPTTHPASVDVLTSETRDDHTRFLLRYRTEPDDDVYAFLLVPKLAPGKKAPGAVVFHGTSSNHIYQPAGLADSTTRHLGLHLVRRGYVVLAPRCFIFAGESDKLTTVTRTASDWKHAVQSVRQRDPRRTGMGKMLWDGICAVDVLTSRPEVDASRVMCIGHSLGAKESLYLVAFDPRVRAAVASEGGVGLSLSNWEAPWYFDSPIKAPGFARDHHELLTLIAPRAIMIVGGGFADGEKSGPWIDAARPVFSLYRKPDHLQLSIHNAGHDFPDHARQLAMDWVERILSESQ